MKLERRRETTDEAASTLSPVRVWLGLRYESRLEGAALAETLCAVKLGWIELDMECRGGGRSSVELSTPGASLLAGALLSRVGATTAAVDVVHGPTTEEFEAIVPTEAAISLQYARGLDPRQPWFTSRRP